MLNIEVKSKLGILMYFVNFVYQVSNAVKLQRYSPGFGDTNLQNMALLAVVHVMTPSFWMFAWFANQRQIHIGSEDQGV